MTPEEKYELFEKYCSQDLSVEDKATLDQILTEDESANQELKVYQELWSHLDNNFTTEKQQQELEDNLKQIGDSYFNTTTTTPKKSKVIQMPRWAYAVAASVALVFGVYFFNQGNPTYDDFATIPELSIGERSASNEDSKNVEKAFNAGDYKAAENYFSSLLVEDPDNTQYQFYYGIALLEQNKYANATTVFESLYKGNSVYRYRALWFEALNQLKQEKYESCAALLKKIPEDAEDYQQAQKLLKKLD